MLGILNLVILTILSLGHQNPVPQKSETLTNPKLAPATKKPGEQKQESRKDSSQKATQSRDSEESLTEDQEYALFHLRKLQTEVKELDDLKTKIKLQGRIADALWPFDPDNARQQFKNAFQEVDVYKEKENKTLSSNKEVKSVQEDIPSIKAGLRNYLVNLLSRHDIELADKLISARTSSDNPIDTKEMSSQRLGLAANIAAASPEQAIAITKDEIKKNLSENSIATLMVIRRNTVQADTVFLEILSGVENDRSFYSYNNLGLLGLYVLGAGQEASMGIGKEINPAVIERYLNFAYKVVEFYMQNSQAAQAAEVNQSFLVLQNLLPLFDRYQPEESVKIRTHLNALGSKVSPKAKEQTLPGDLDEISVENLLDLANRTLDLKKQNGLFTRAAFLAAQQGDYEKAITIAQKLSDSEEKKDTISILHFQAGRKAIASKNVAQALEHARNTSIPIQRWTIFLSIVDLKLGEKDKNSAKELLTEIESYVEKIDDTDPDKARGLFDIASIWDRVSADRKSSLIKSAIVSLNSVNFDKPPKKNRTKVSPENFIFESLWTSLAKSDLNQALSLARLIENKFISTTAQINSCKAILLDIKKLSR